MIREAKKESKESGLPVTNKVNPTDDHPFFSFDNKTIGNDEEVKLFWPITITLLSREISNNYPPPKQQFI